MLQSRSSHENLAVMLVTQGQFAVPQHQLFRCVNSLIINDKLLALCAECSGNTLWALQENLLDQEWKPTTNWICTHLKSGIETQATLVELHVHVTSSPTTMLPYALKQDKWLQATTKLIEL